MKSFEHVGTTVLLITARARQVLTRKINHSHMEGDSTANQFVHRKNEKNNFLLRSIKYRPIHNSQLFKYE
jgi:hypothetical protein